MKKILIFLSAVILIILAVVVYISRLFGPPATSEEMEVFIVPQEKSGFDVVQALFEQKFIKNAKAFQFLLDNFAPGSEIKSGGYRLNQSTNAWAVMKKITGKEDLKWVAVSFCPRKEQVGEKLAGTLGWDQEKLDEWNALYKNSKSEYFEGVYYPDTYLLPVDESASQTAQRFIDHFNEKFAPLADKFIAKNIKWTTGLKIASLIAREAGGVSDMKIISGVIWNRLNTGMRLQIDATMQYTLGKNADGSWWGNVDIAEKQKDSPYNSYLYKGLPPTPICSPNIDAIEAALNPAETDCLFYLHDSGGNIHCAKTYAEHKANIKKYL